MIVESVVDGDTLRLRGGSTLRLIGINAPEVAHHDMQGEPFGTAAATAMRRRIAPEARIGLAFDAERRDRHGRLLAHAYTLPGRDNLQAWLLAAGLARQLVIPPNVAHQECYRNTELAARSQGHGLWASPTSNPILVSRLPRSMRGFAHVEGRAGKVRTTRAGAVVELGTHFHLFIDRRDMEYFRGMDMRRWQGQRLHVRGYITTWRGRQSMRLRHPANLEARSGKR